MKQLYKYSLGMAFLLSVHAHAQETTVRIRFDQHVFKLLEVNKKTDLPPQAQATDIQRFYTHFQVDDYQQYRRFYYQENCLATEDDFENWREFVRGQEIDLLARFILESSEHTLSILQYRMGKNGNYLYGPLAFQKIENTWYLLSLQQSMDLMQVKGFFTYIRPEILEGVEDPATWSQKPAYRAYVSAGGVLDGKKLLEIYPTRYHSDNPDYTTSRTLFRNVSETDEQYSKALVADFKALGKEYQISKNTMSMVEIMCREGNYALAIETIYAESNAENIIEVTQKFNGIQSR